MHFYASCVLRVATLLCRFTSTGWYHWSFLFIQVGGRSYMNIIHGDTIQAWLLLSGQTSICMTITASCIWATSRDLMPRNLLHRKLLKCLRRFGFWCSVAPVILASCRQRWLQSPGRTSRRIRHFSPYRYVLSTTCEHIVVSSLIRQSRNRILFLVFSRVTAKGV